MNDYERAIEAIEHALHTVESINAVDPDIEGHVEDAQDALKRAKELCEQRQGEDGS